MNSLRIAPHQDTFQGLIWITAVLNGFLVWDFLPDHDLSSLDLGRGHIDLPIRKFAQAVK